MPIPQHFGVVTPYIVVKNADSYVRLLKDGAASAYIAVFLDRGLQINFRVADITGQS